MEHTSSINKINNFIQRENTIDKLASTFYILAALYNNENITQELNDIIRECKHLNLIKKSTKFEPSESKESLKDLILRLSDNEIKDCKKLIYQSLQKNVTTESEENISIQELLSKWLLLIDDICSENYAKNNLANREILNNSLSIIKISFKSATEAINSYLQYFNIIENKYINLANKLKKITTTLISSISGVPSWQKLKGISPIFIPQLIQYLSIKEMKALRATNFWLYYEITRHIKSVNIYKRDEIDGKIKAFSFIGGINKITFAKKKDSWIPYYSEDMKRISSILNDADFIDSLKSMHFNDCNLNGIDFISNLNDFSGLENIEIDSVNLLPVLSQKEIPNNAFFFNQSNLKNLTSIEIKHSYISNFLIASLSHLPNLRKLIIRSNYFWREKNSPRKTNSDEVFSFLKDLQQLKHLEINSKEINLSNNILSYLHELKFLESLVLFYCKDITDEGFKKLFENNIKKIKELILADCPNVTDRGIQYLSKSGLDDLENIEFGLFDELTDQSLEYFREIKSLKYLYLQDCPQITHENVKKLNENSDHLKVSLVSNE